MIFSIESKTGLKNLGKYIKNNSHSVNGVFVLNEGMLLYSRKVKDSDYEQIKLDKENDQDNLIIISGKKKEIESFVFINLLELITDYVETLPEDKTIKKANLSLYYKIKHEYKCDKIE